MNITILGAGAMGSLFSGYLSKGNNVSVIDVNGNTVKAINEEGVRIREKDGSIGTYHPAAYTDSSTLGVQDLIIVFVKSMFTISALESNKGLIVRIHTS